MGDSFSTTLSPTICQGSTYTLPNGQIVSAPGVYQVTIPRPICDSIYNINLTTAPNYLFNIPISLCAGENYTLPNGQIVNAAGQYSIQLNTINGCDSLIN